MIKEQIFDKLLHKELGFGWYVDRNKQYGKTHSFKEKIEVITPKIKDNVSFLKSKNIIPVWVFITVPSKEFKDYLTSLSKELSIVLVDPEAVYRESFPGLKNMATKHSAHFIPEVYEILANKVFKKVFVIK